MAPGLIDTEMVSGDVVDEAALIQALQDGVIAGAGLDVYEREPLVPQGLLDAPNATLRLNATSFAPDEASLGFGPGEFTLNLSPTGDLHEAARNLFSMLHQLDATATRIAVSPIPTHGLGEAINDRLKRAAAPRG